jgi:hypothetical protein
LAQSRLPESVHLQNWIQVKRQDRLIWLEYMDRKTVVGRLSLVVGEAG